MESESAASKAQRIAKQHTDEIERKRQELRKTLAERDPILLAFLDDVKLWFPGARLKKLAFTKYPIVQP